MGILVDQVSVSGGFLSDFGHCSNSFCKFLELWERMRKYKKLCEMDSDKGKSASPILDGEISPSLGVSDGVSYDTGSVT